MRIYKGEVPPTQGVAIAQDAGTSEGVKKSWLKRERAKQDANVDTLDKGRGVSDEAISSFFTEASNRLDDGSLYDSFTDDEWDSGVASAKIKDAKEKFKKDLSDFAGKKIESDELWKRLKDSGLFNFDLPEAMSSFASIGKGFGLEIPSSAESVSTDSSNDVDAKIDGLIEEYKQLEKKNLDWRKPDYHEQTKRKSNLRRLLSTLRCFTPTGKVKSPREKRSELVKVADDVIMQFADKGIIASRYMTMPSQYNNTDNKFFVPHGTSFEGIKIGEQYAACILDQSGSFGDLIAIAHRVKA